MRIFVSSVIAGFEHFREAASAAIQSLDHQVIRAEDFAPSPSSPQIACLQGIRAADAVVLVLGQRYGEIQPSGWSATHEEFQEARSTKPIFVFIQAGIEPEPRQAALIAEAQSWVTGHFTGRFSDEGSLRSLITRALHRWEMSIASGAVDPNEMAARANAALPGDRDGRFSSEASVAISIAVAPEVSILRPSELEAASFGQRITKEALFGDPAIFDSRAGTETEIAEHCLVLSQEDRRLSISELGSIVMVLPLPPAAERYAAPLIEEDVTQTILTGFRFADRLLEIIDPTQRITSLAPAVKLLNAQHTGWKTRAQQQRDPTTMTIGMLDETELRALASPPNRSRAIFRRDADKLAQDLMVLLRRHFKRR